MRLQTSAPAANPPDALPAAPQGRKVVLHTRVVTGTGGGPDKTILYSAPFLADSPYWLAAAYMHPRGDAGFAVIQQRAAQIGCPLIGVADTGPLDLRIVHRFWKICRQYRVAVWHGHDYKSNLLGLAVRRLWPMKLVSTVHGWVRHTRRTPLYYALDRWSLRHYDRVICVSQDLQDQVLAGGVDPTRTTVVHNAIDHHRFSRLYPASQSPLRKQMGTPPGRVVIGAAGRLSPEKGFDQLIEAAACLVKQQCDVELWIAGEGDSQTALQQQIDGLQLGQRVKLLGFQQDVLAFYHALDLFVLSSLREGLPNVVLEAMAMSLPVVATRVAGVPNLIDDQVTGLLCPPGDAAALAQAMGQLVASRDFRGQLALAGRSRIDRHYTFARRMQRIQSIYDDVLLAT